MHTQENHHSYTYQKSKHKHRLSARKKRMRRLKIKIALSASVFTLTLAAAACWHLSRSQTITLENFSAETVSVLPVSDTDKKPASKKKGMQKLPDTGTDSETVIIDTVSFSEEWNLILINSRNPLPDNYQMNLTGLSGGHAIDSRCYPYLQQMMDDCRADGLYPVICSSYRTQEDQEALFQERIQELTEQGYSFDDAQTLAAGSVARPGTSEHQAGLAVDIVDKSYQILDAAQEYTQVQQWLMQNSWKYGFILRYPENKSSLTGIIYEPWHYRYVGRKAAEEIYEQGICLEEYLARE